MDRINLTMKKLLLSLLLLPLALFGQPTVPLANTRFSGTNNVVLDSASLKFGTTTPGSISGASGAITIAASGTNQSITLTPSGTGTTRLSGGGTGLSGSIYNTSASGISGWLFYANDGATGKGSLGFANSGYASPFTSSMYINSAAGVGLILSTADTPAVTFDTSQNAVASGNWTLSGTKTLQFGATAAATIGVSADTTAADLVVTTPSTGSLKLATGNGGGLIIDNSANTGFLFIKDSGSAALKIESSGGNSYISTQVAGQSLYLRTNTTTALQLDGSQNAIFAGTVTTSAPTGGAGAWELGIANAVSPTAPNRTITIEIGGTVYYLHAKTTND